MGRHKTPKHVRETKSRGAPTTCRNWTLAGISASFLAAFSSLYYQVHGLYSDQGVLPLRHVLTCDAKSEPQKCIADLQEGSLLYVHQWLDIHPSSAMELICLMGLLLSALQILFARLREPFSYLALLIMYSSCVRGGQTFLHFQWDSLLTEAGFLAVLVAPRISRHPRFSWYPHDNIPMFLVKWLAFRLMFASGVVKLTSHCPTWWGLTALDWHFESQCLPTWPAWWAHQLPGWFKALSVVGTYAIEIAVPFFYLLPFKHLRKFAFGMQVVLMASIMLTGSYNFFNILTIAISIPLLHTSDHSNFGSHVWSRSSRVAPLLKWIAIVMAYTLLVYFTVDAFNLRLDLESGSILSQVAFNKDTFYRWLAHAVPLSMVLGSVAFVCEVVAALARSFTDQASLLSKVYALGQTGVMAVLCGVLFASSLVPLSWLERGAFEMLPTQLVKFHNQHVDPLNIVNSYGLFRSMTGVGGRPELVVEGANDPEGPWREYGFRYKPGALDRRPGFIIPHQPRLDWQMWFAALGKYGHNPWFVSLLDRVLRGEGAVLHLMGENPFEGQPPKFIRAQLYLYHYTSLFPHDKHHSNTSFWWRELDHEYLPALPRTGLANFLSSTNLHPAQASPSELSTPLSKQLTAVLESVRALAHVMDGATFVLAVFAAVLLPALLTRKLS